MSKVEAYMIISFLCIIISHMAENRIEELVYITVAAIMAVIAAAYGFRSWKSKN